MSVQVRNARTHLIRLIHVARRDLGMEDDAYRAIVARIADGKTSSADCTVLELERIIDHLKKAGFKVRKPKTAAPAERRPLATDRESRKLRAIWLLLHQVGATQSNTEASLAAYVKRMTGCDALQFVKPHDRYALIEGLKGWAARELKKAIDARLQRMHGAGMLPPELRAEHIAGVVAPTLNPRTFDSLREVWSWLEAREAGKSAAVDITVRGVV